MKLRSGIGAVGALMFAASPVMAAAQSPPPPATEVGAAGLALANLPAKSSAKLTVTSPAFTPGGDIAFENTQYKGNTFPGFSWSAGPSGTKTYAIIMQDGDGARNGEPFLHWTVFNIAPTTTKLEAGMSAVPTGAQYGPNYKGTNQPYLGPRTPAGPKHRYHIQVFALDASLTLEPTVNYPSLVASMKDHVLASGELIGLGQQMVPPL
ncbi:MAG: YbhB/YbcL family Raf kinase inhibitor-like protein [Gemmatimonadaceae bacterium]